MARFLDSLVAALVIGSFLFVPSILVIAEIRGGDPTGAEMLVFLNAHYRVYPAAGTIICTALVLWMCFGDGARSALWKWLPPLALFRTKSEVARWILVLLLVSVAGLGVIGDLAGLMPPL